MKKREFLKALGLGLVGASAGRRSWAEVPPSRARRPPKIWAWSEPHEQRSKDEWKRALDDLRVSGVDAVLVEVYNGRNAFWDSKRLPVKSDVLGMVLPLAHNHGIEIHAWIWTMPCLIPEIMKKHPDWYNVNAKGESTVDKPAYVDYYRFLDPARPEVREFVKGTVSEICDIPTLMGVHLDYVRHPDAILPKALWSKYKIVQDKVYPPYDYGYTEYNRKIFKQKHGVDPLKLADPTSNKDWMQYRWDAVTDLVNDYLVPAARTRGRLITAAVFPGPSLARQMVRQDWGRWNLDAFLPMLYAGFYNAGPDWMKAYTQEAVGAVKVPIYSGVYVADSDPPQVEALVRAALDGGAAGVSLFNADAMTPEKWKALQTVLAAG